MPVLPAVPSTKADPRPDQAARFSIPQQSRRGAVLDAASGIEESRLGEDFAARQLGSMFPADQRLLWPIAAGQVGRNAHRFKGLDDGPRRRKDTARDPSSNAEPPLRPNDRGSGTYAFYPARRRYSVASERHWYFGTASPRIKPG